MGGLVVVTVAVAAGWWLLSGKVWSKPEQGPLTHAVSRGPFIHEVIERGEVESSSSIEVRCEVQSRNSTGTAILELVPEGTFVRAGDVLARLDSSALENERDQQQVVCNASEAALIQARNAYETALIAKQEYLEGTYRQEEQLIQGEIFVAEENLRRAQEYANHSRKLAARGFVTAVTLEADLFAVEKAKKDLEAAKTKLRVLQDLTKAKMLKQLDADIKTAEAQLRSQENIYQIDLDKLELIKQQIEKCVVRAPQDGEVTYANSTDYRDEVLIAEGVQVRERQALFRLPDPKRMQVNAKVNESRIRLIKIGDPAKIKVETLAGAELTGRVVKVFAYANRSRWSSSSVKEFSVIVEIHNPPPGLRTGSSAEVKIRVNQSPSELQVPVQAVVEHGGQYYCLKKKAGPAWEAIPVELGPTNDSFVVIRSGLSDSDSVVLNARNYLDQVDLPEVPARSMDPEEMLATAPGTGAPGSPPGTLVQATGNPAGSSAAAGSPGEASPGERPSPAEIAGFILQRLDTDGDGRLSSSEVEAAPAERRPNFASADKNGDGYLDAGELAAMPRRRGPRPGGPGGPGGPPGGQTLGGE